MVKSPPANAGDLRLLGCIPGWGKFIPRRRLWQPTPVFLPGESHGQRSLEGYGPWGHNEWARSEQFNMPAGEQACLKAIPTTR